MGEREPGVRVEDRKMSDWSRGVLLRAFNVWLIGATIALYVTGAGAMILTHADVGFDFHVFYTAARSITHGHPVYDPNGLAHVRAVAQHDLSVPASKVAWAVYPPLLYELLVPFSYL